MVSASCPCVGMVDARFWQIFSACDHEGTDDAHDSSDLARQFPEADRSPYSHYVNTDRHGGSRQRRRGHARSAHVWSILSFGVPRCAVDLPACGRRVR